MAVNWISDNNQFNRYQLAGPNACFILLSRIDLLAAKMTQYFVVCATEQFFFFQAFKAQEARMASELARRSELEYKLIQEMEQKKLEV